MRYLLILLFIVGCKGPERAAMAETELGAGAVCTAIDASNTHPNRFACVRGSLRFECVLSDATDAVACAVVRGDTLPAERGE